MFLKLYFKSETGMASLAGGVDEKTFCKWTRIFIHRISFLYDDVVSVFTTRPMTTPTSAY